MSAVSATLTGDGYRFDVGLDAECLVFRVEANGWEPRGGTVCPQGERFDPVQHPQVHLNPFTSTADLLVVSYDGCVRAPAVQGMRDSDVTVTTICDSRIPSLVFGRLAGEVAYGCLVHGGSGHFVAPGSDGVFLERDPGWSGPGFALAFGRSGQFIGDPPVDAPFAPGLASCEAHGPWRTDG